MKLNLCTYETENDMMGNLLFLACLSLLYSPKLKYYPSAHAAVNTKETYLFRY
jgi:hypothetical protein